MANAVRAFSASQNAGGISHAENASVWHRVGAAVRKIVNQWAALVQPMYQYYGRRTPGTLPVTPYSALNSSAVFFCARSIAETLAMLPWGVFEQRPDGTSQERNDNSVAYLLSKRPNPDVPAISFREMIVMQMLLWGNAYAEIEWNNNGTPKAFWQVPAQRVVVDRDVVTGKVLYRLSGDAWNAGRTVLDDDMLHWRNIGVDGYNGLSTVQLAQNTISFGLEMEAFGATAFRNAPYLAGWISFPGKLPDEEKTNRLKRSFREKYMGASKAGEVPILESGMEFHQLGLPLKDAQFLESRAFQAAEIARWFKMPLSRLGLQPEGADPATEEIAFYNETLLPMTVRLQQEVDYKLFEGFTRTSKFYSKHSLAPILKGALDTRYTAYSTALRYGFLSINEVRQLEDLDPVPSGDMRCVQLNTVPLDGYQERADMALEQAQADIEYRQAQTAQTEKGLTPPAPDAIGQPGQNPFEQTQAENPPADETRAVKAAAKRTVRLAALLVRHDGLQPAMPLTTTQNLDGALRNGHTNHKPVT